jgi:hypothetical protein
MSLILSLKQFFTAAKIAKVIETAPPTPSTVLDRLFPEAVRQQWDSPVIPVEELLQNVGVMPVVSRGGQPAMLNAESSVGTYVEPLPLKIASKVDAVSLNNLKLGSPLTREQWARRKTLALRRAVKASTEAMAAQCAFDGHIQYPMLLDSGSYQDYTVAYGGESIQTKNVTAEAKWDHAEITRAKVYNFLSSLATDLDRSGYGGDKIVHAGALAYGALLNLLESEKESKIPARLAEDGAIILGKFKIYEMSETWKKPKDGSTVQKLADKEIRMNTMGATGLYYGALDDLDANLQPLPLFVKPVEDKRGGSLELIAHSKPLPAIAPRSVMKAVVLT